MKKNTFTGLILALILMIGFSLAACDSSDDSSDPLKGTWRSTDGSIMLNAANGAFKEFFDGIEVIRGTYTYSGNIVTAKVIEVNPAIFGRTGSWVQFSNLSNADKAYFGNTDTYMLTINGNTVTFMGYTMVKQ
jgi:hypothetical protein